MKSLLIISQYFPPDITAASFRIGELARFLAKSGEVDVNVLTTTPHRIVLQDTQHFIPESKVCRIKVNSKNRFVQYFEFLRKGKRFLNSSDNYNCILVSSPPISVFQLLKNIKNGVRIILDVRDLWPDTPVAAGKLKRGIIYEYFKRYERSMYKKANAITAVSKPMASYIEEMVPNKNICVIYNGIPRKDYEAAIRNHENERRSNEHLNIVYAGNIGLLQGMEVVPEAISLLNNLDISLEIIGDGVLKSQLQEALENKVTFREPMPRDELLEYLRERADVLFFNLKKDPILEKTIPSKLFDYLLLSRPIITGIKGEGREILKKTGAAVFFEQDSSASLTEAIKEMKRNYDIYYRNATENCLNIAKSFIRESMYQKILEIILENES
ncbi:MAG: glycosyltransferase family 4 protein [Mesotoga sp.]